MIIVFGENHTHFDEVQRIRNSIKKIKPDLILHELDWEESELKQIFNVKPLEPNLKINKLDSLSKTFMMREENMIKVIKQYINHYKKIVIVVGDTHLRSTNEICENKLKLFLESINANIIRSNFKEIN